MTYGDINRLEYLVLYQLYLFDCVSYYHSCTITELIKESSVELGARMTVYNKLKMLMQKGYVSKGVIDDHADTYFLLQKSIDLIESENKSNESKE